MHQLLKGTYVFPPGIDGTPHLLFKEVTKASAKLSIDKLAMYIMVEDFKYYWQQANEHILSLYSGLCFGNYKVASFNHNLSALHMAKISECV